MKRRNRSRLKMQKMKAQDSSAEIKELRARLEEAEATLEAIRTGQVDGLVVSTPKGEQIYTISGAEKPYRVLIEEMKEGAVIVSEDNKVLYCNKGFAEILKRPMEKIIGEDIHTIVSPTHMSSFEALMTSGRMGKGVMTMEIALKTDYDTVIPTQISINSLIAGDVKTTFLVVVDLTQHMEEDIKRYTANLEEEINQRKKAENALKKIQNNLEEIINERTKQLKDSERLAAIGATAGMVGHDIRNPLQAIAGDLYLIDNDVSSLSADETKISLQESVRSVQDNLLYIAKIVEDLQDYAKPQKPNLQRIHFDKVIEEVMLLVPVSSNHQVVIEIEQGFPEIVADFSMMKRVLTNLVNNAIQAMPNDGQLTIRANHKGTRVSITVEDTGVGIPENIKPKLFEPMVTTKAKGQGLGLAVVKRLVEAQGGTISFESKVGEGTKFVVTLPLNK
jgi:PAS domain S-box-containing protein